MQLKSYCRRNDECGFQGDLKKKKKKKLDAKEIDFIVE